MKLTLTLFQRGGDSLDGVMTRLRALLVPLALLYATGLTAPAPAHDATAPCLLCEHSKEAAEQRPGAPVTLDVEARLDFNQLVLTGAGSGSAELRPDGSRMVSGSVAAISARAVAGEVAIRGEPGRQVRVDLPRSIELAGLNGSSVRLESIHSDLPPAPKLDSNGRLSFRFGGIVRVTGDTDGEFRGDVRINVEYF